MDFHEILYLRIFQNLSRKLKFNSTWITGTLHDKQYTFLLYLNHFVVEWEMFQTNVVEKIKIYILCSITFFPPWKLWDKVGEYCRAGQVTDDNMAHVYCMMDTKGYKLTLRICNTYCFFQGNSGCMNVHRC